MLTTDVYQELAAQTRGEVRERVWKLRFAVGASVDVVKNNVRLDVGEVLKTAVRDTSTSYVSAIQILGGRR
ncbi:MAG TPA: hypothetical protein VJO15_04315, partial [Dehalococcoidia bacterium]|nr:hypothetical protein [Dehalococcoidia bacterium]